MKIEILRKNIDEAAKKVAILSAKRDECDAAAAASREAAQSAAAAGDVDGYLQGTKAAEKHEAEKYVTNVQIQKIGRGYTPSDVTDSWTNYAKDFNATFDKKYSAFLKARTQLWEMYRDLMNLQGSALKERKYCGDLLSLEEGSPEAEKTLPMHTIPAENAPGLRYKNYFFATPDIAYFLATGEANEQTDMEAFNAYVRQHKAV